VTTGQEEHLGIVYAALFVCVLGLWPCALWRDDNPGLSVLWFALNTGAVALVWFQSTSEDTGFFAGLETVGEQMRLGFVPLSLMALACIYPIVFALAGVHALLGLALGRAYAQRRWTGLVQFFENML
jgi:hypothetical protein